MIRRVEIGRNQYLIVHLPEWIWSLSELEYYQKIQRQLLLNKVIGKTHPRADYPIKVKKDKDIKYK